MGIAEALHQGIDRMLDVSPLRRMRIRRYERYFAEGKPFLAHRGIYTSYAEAAASAPSTQPVGYDNDAAPVVHDFRIRHVWPSDYPALFWLGRSFLDRCKRVFDLGGNVGVSYYSFERFIPYPADLRWLVCDVPSTVKEGRQLAEERDPHGRLTFTTSADEGTGFDLWLACGVLQYLPQPLHEILGGLAEKPPRLLVNSVALHPERSFFTLQNIEGNVFVPYRVSKRDEFVAGLEALGYQVVDRWDVVEKRCTIPFAPEHSVDRFQGFYLERK
jgi:putative methyltransferase (TIGR04325 family)